MATLLGIHLFLGSNRPRKLQRIQEMERSLGVGPLDSHRIEASQLSAAELTALCRQRPSQATSRLVVIDDAHRLGTDAVEALEHYAESIAANACVVLMTETNLTARQPLSKAPEGWHAETFADPDTSNKKPFALVEALGQRNPLAALSALKDQMSGGREPEEVIGMLNWMLQRWLSVRRLLDERMSADRVAASLGIKPWQVERLQQELAGRSLASLQALLEHCWQADAEMKSGRALAVPALERLILEICGPIEKAGKTRAVSNKQ